MARLLSFSLQTDILGTARPQSPHNLDFQNHFISYS